MSYKSIGACLKINFQSSTRTVLVYVRQVPNTCGNRYALECFRYVQDAGIQQQSVGSSHIVSISLIPFENFGLSLWYATNWHNLALLLETIRVLLFIEAWTEHKGFYLRMSLPTEQTIKNSWLVILVRLLTLAFSNSSNLFRLYFKWLSF